MGIRAPGFSHARFASRYHEYLLRKLAFLRQRPEFEGSYALDAFFASLRRRAPCDRSIDFLTYALEGRWEGGECGPALP